MNRNEMIIKSIRTVCITAIVITFLILSLK